MILAQREGEKAEEEDVGEEGEEAGDVEMGEEPASEADEEGGTSRVWEETGMCSSW